MRIFALIWALGAAAVAVEHSAAAVAQSAAAVEQNAHAAALAKKWWGKLRRSRRALMVPPVQ